MLIKFAFLGCIDNIINLGGKNFKYSHFSFSSEGDMIIDTHQYPVENTERRFFGLKKMENFISLIQITRKPHIIL